MFFSLIFAFIVSTCCGSQAVTPPVVCGEMPNTIFSCLGNPKFIKMAMSDNCGKEISECDKMTCIFTVSGLLKDGKVEKQKLIAQYDQFEKDHPQWSAAVQYVKEVCINTDLPAQGPYLNCPAYDIVFCSSSSFIKNAQPSQWSTAEHCQYPKQFATACPVCPHSCFAPLVPYGSCNACLELPRSLTRSP